MLLLVQHMTASPGKCCQERVLLTVLSWQAVIDPNQSNSSQARNHATECQRINQAMFTICCNLHQPSHAKQTVHSNSHQPSGNSTVRCNLHQPSHAQTKQASCRQYNCPQPNLVGIAVRRACIKDVFNSTYPH